MDNRFLILEVVGDSPRTSGEFAFIWHSENVDVFVFSRRPNLMGEQPLDLDRLSPQQIADQNLRNQSFAHWHRPSRTLTMVRDWPGCDMVFYSVDAGVLKISTDINALVSEPAAMSRRGVFQYLDDRKHFHNNTIFKKIKELHPGHMIVFQSNTASISLQQWYVPICNIKKTSVEEATERYFSSIKDYFDHAVPDRDSFVAIMFSGGSDSLFLLQIMKSLGYKNINLYTCCVANQTDQEKYAERSASFFEEPVRIVKIAPDTALDAWLEYIPRVYHCLSEMRLDGMPIYLDQAYRQIVDDAVGKTPFVVWGSQYSVISPTASTAGIMYSLFILVVFKTLQMIPGTKHLRASLLRKALSRYPVFSPKISDQDALDAYLDGAYQAFERAKSVGAIVNFLLLSNYNSLKRWWMAHRDIMARKVDPRIQNSYPFHDRTHQEQIMDIPLAVRVGGILNIFKMPSSYKVLFYSMIDKRITEDVFSRGNYKTLNEFFMLFKNDRCYDFLQVFFENNRKLINEVFGAPRELNLTKDEYLALSSMEVEQLFGVVYVCIKSGRHVLTSFDPDRSRDFDAMQ
jgi:hypothetical protein